MYEQRTYSQPLDYDIGVEANYESRKDSLAGKPNSKKALLASSGGARCAATLSAFAFSTRSARNDMRVKGLAPGEDAQIERTAVAAWEPKAISSGRSGGDVA